MSDEFAVALDTLLFYDHEDGVVERGLELYRRGGVGLERTNELSFEGSLAAPGGVRLPLSVTFTKDGRALNNYRCGCNPSPQLANPLCRHVAAAVLTAQGGVKEGCQGVSGELKICEAEREDALLIYKFILGLAEYENKLYMVRNDRPTLERWLFDERCCEAIIARIDGIEAGFALWYTSYSTFIGVKKMYVEDLYVKPQLRKRGIARALFSSLAGTAASRGHACMEWACLNWNEKGAGFYRSMGAKANMNEWTAYHLSGEALRELQKK
ncbi:MAG: GNAT family N-acetyltransferase [Deltaproteobacteria bacterium]|jgi:GNAT superfamily N-acetyltransferase|nr:GNAT family N-acetyltransferase [Deltaproteobacteria bacterium]